ncbi:hypothetical protein K2173_022478 [Erythroxylum novogranatense]|uniref:J domain-containing protein n=1 Tax=Erythroxylum novogranatense TaxID=1862640 RepID=A0AAV8TJT8_9ROSI|nr:hypothetical protein K2173_022478 [Erythroxylum novogranatense]
MGPESDSKSKLVVQICSFSTSLIACKHRQIYGSVSSRFIDWYRLLGVDEDSDMEVIRKQYRKLGTVFFAALQLHPDKNKHPKAEIAFKLVLEAYSCLSNDSKRRDFNLVRRKHFCIDCNGIPYVPEAKQLRNASRSSCIRQEELRNIKERFREEAIVMERCLRTNSATRNESPVFNLSDRLFQNRDSRKESPVFDPSNYMFQGYPHIRNRIYREPTSFWCSQRSNLYSSNGQWTRTRDSPMFENRSSDQLFKHKSTCVRS